MLLQLFGVGMVFLVIAIVAALFGFGVVSDDSPLSAKLFAVLFFIASVATFSWAWINRTPPVTQDR